MLCLACHRPGSSILCSECRLSLRPAPDRLLPGGVRLVSAFEHEGAARDLIHHFKYLGITSYADLVAEVLAPRLPRLPLVPVPRALSRRLRYGIDPARWLAQRLSLRTGAPVFHSLEAPWHSVRRAGGDHRRPPAGFRSREPVPQGLILVDDVVTTGGTLRAAIRTLGEDRVRIAIAANAVAGECR